MIYDCFSFFNELDVLEIRLNVLNDIVDKFVLVEAPWTHTGHPKPLYFEENKARYAPFLDKIIHIVVSDADLPPFPADATERDIAWIRENVQRNAIAKGLTEAKPDDVIIIADLDEIPSPEAIRTTAQAPTGITNLNLRNYAFFLNNLNVSLPNWTGGPQLLTHKTFYSPVTYVGFRYSEYAPECANGIPSATAIRFAKKNRSVKNAGWHFSSMGGVAALKAKIQSFAHTEFSNTLPSDDVLEKRLRSGEGIFYGGESFMAEPLEIALPPFLRDNQAKLRTMLLPANLTTWNSHRLRRTGLRLRKTVHDKFIGAIIALVPRSLHPFFAKIRRVFQ